VCVSVRALGAAWEPERGGRREQQSGFWKDAWARIDMGSSVIGVFKLMVAELTLFLLLAAYLVNAVGELGTGNWRLETGGDWRLATRDYWFLLRSRGAVSCFVSPNTSSRYQYQASGWSLLATSWTWERGRGRQRCSIQKAGHNDILMFRKVEPKRIFSI